MCAFAHLGGVQRHSYIKNVEKYIELEYNEALYVGDDG